MLKNNILTTTIAISLIALTGLLTLQNVSASQTTYKPWGAPEYCKGEKITI
jgi:hypothetical protein